MRMTESEYRAHQAKHGRSTRASVIRPGSVAAKREVAKKKKPDYARILAEQIREAGLPAPVLEWAFDAQLDGSGRGWRFDLCWPKWLAVDVGQLAIEVDGAVHRIKGRWKADMPKHQAAFALGYKLLRVSPEQVRNGEALEIIRRALR